jgi:hypothetical protein
LYDLIIVLHQPAVTYVYVGNMTQLFESGIRNFFSKQTKSQNLIELYLFSENQTLRNAKPCSLIFVASAFGLDFFHIGLLTLFSHFSCLTPWIFKSSNLAHSLILS